MISAIGPRPVTLEETYEYGDARDEALTCKPGITGWWAATDCNDSTWRSGQRQARELWHCGHRSIRFSMEFLPSFDSFPLNRGPSSLYAWIWAMFE